MSSTENLNNLAQEIWKSAETLRGKFRAYENQSLSLAAQNVDTLSDRVWVSISINGEVVDSISRSGKPWCGAIAKYKVVK